MNNKSIIGILIILLVLGYFMRSETFNPAPLGTRSNKNVIKSNTTNSVQKNNISSNTFEKNQLSSKKQLVITQQKDTIPSNWKTYTNSSLGITFRYPNSWTKNGEESKAINLKGELVSITLNLMDKTTQSVFSITLSLPTYGIEAYKIEEEQYNFYKNSNKLDIKKIIVAGNIAIESFTTMSKDIKGNIYDPALRLVHIVFLDKQKTIAFNLNFRTLEPGSENEIAKFQQLLTTIKLTK